VISSAQRPLPDNTQLSQEKNIHVPGWIGTHNPSKRAAADPCLNVVIFIVKVKVKVIPQQAEVAQGVPGRLRLQIFLTFGTTRVVGRQPYALAAFTPGEIPESTPGHMVPSWGAMKKFPVTPPGIDPGTIRLVAQCLNHYATPGTIHSESQ